MEAGPDAGDASSADFPPSLSETGLYADVASERLADGVQAYAPKFELWSDGASKRRWLFLPPGTQIDTSDPDSWSFPVGTRAWKEFTRDGVRVETRLMHKAADGWKMVAYVWRQDESDADAMELGAVDARGTPHDVPDRITCMDCHAGRADRLLGVSAVQLAHDGDGLSLFGLAEQGRLTAPPLGSLQLPGDATAQTALGGMHANCGHCHNPEHGEVFDKAKGLSLWLTADGLQAVADTTIYRSTVDRDLSDDLDDYVKRIVAGQPADSGLIHRMELMPGSSDAMPPVAVELVNTDLTQAVRAWVKAL